MKTRVSLVSAVAFLAFSSNAFAADYQAQVDRCLQQYANTHDQASVTLGCDAQGGKLVNCKVVDSSVSGKGFDKAALCVAEFLPMAGKTGAVKVPFRFAGDA